MRAPRAATCGRAVSTATSVRQYQLGLGTRAAGTSWRGRSALPDDVLVESGLGFLNRRGGQTDAFRERLLFPIFDVNGDPVAFGGRLLPGGDGPKYKNSPGSAIYDKSKVLYGLNWAKSDVVNADEAIVCEGYTDVIGFAAAGVPRAVATCGTALTEEHLRLLRRFARRVVLAFDADAAGQNAAARFYQWERDLELDVAVAALPAGRRPRRPRVPAIPARCRSRWSTRCRSSASGSTACSRPRRWARPKAARGPPSRRSP